MSRHQKHLKWIYRQLNCVPKDYGAQDPLCLGWACCQATLGGSIAVHSEKQRWTSSSKKCKTSPIKAGGGGGGRFSKVHQLAEAATLPKLLGAEPPVDQQHSHPPNCLSNLEASARLCAKKLGTKDYISN